MTDVIVIGAGHNGMLAAAQLAESGASVVLLERSEAVGGICRQIEFAAGYFAPGLLHDLAFDVKRCPSLGEHVIADPPVWISGEDGIRSVSADLSGVEGAQPWREFLSRVRPFAQAVLSQPPPPILPATTADFWKLGRTGLGLRRLGRGDMVELMRVPPMCAADWVNEHFESDPALAEWIASAGVRHGFAGPWSAGTAANLLLASVMKERAIRGSGAAVTEALRARCEATGVDVRTSSTVERIVIESGRATGVEVGGKVLSARAILSSCDPRTTFLDLIDPVWLPSDIERQFLAIRARGTTAKMMLALDGPFELEGATNVERAYLGGGSLDGLERAFDAVKYGEFSEKPVLDVFVPTVSQPDFAPEGHHVVSVLVSFVPYSLRAGWSHEQKAELERRVLARLSESAPTLRDRIVASQLWTPVDIEREFGLSGGCLQHVEHALDQLFFMRPTPSSAHYTTPIEGLFLGGGGSHPCGGVTGIPGQLAAQAVRRAL